jgi:hypothetical protein
MGGRPRCLPRNLAACMPAVTRSLINEAHRPHEIRPVHQPHSGQGKYAKQGPGVERKGGSEASPQ